MSEEEKVAVVNIFSSFNNTVVHATDITGSNTLAFSSGGRHVKADRLKPGKYAAMMAAVAVAEELKKNRINKIIIKVRGVGGSGPKVPGPGAQAAIRSLARSGLLPLKIEDVTPVPHDGCRRPGGRKGRRV